MHTESQVLIFKKKVADYSLIVLIFVVMFGLLQAFNTHRQAIIGFGTQAVMNNIV